MIFIKSFRPLSSRKEYQKMVYKDPVNVENTLEFKRTKALPLKILLPVVLQLRKVWVYQDGTVLKLPFIVSESMAHATFATLNFKLKLIKRFFSFKKVTLNNKTNYLLANDHWGFGYFHWLCDVTQRLNVIGEHLQEYTLLLPENFNTNYHKKTLDFYGINNITFLKTFHIYNVPNLFLPEHIATSGNYLPENIGITRNLFVQNKATFSMGDFIYISRKKTGYRLIINEDEIVEFLQNKGFQILIMENYTFEQQIAIANSAKCMVSIHGAGLTNMLFMNQGAKVMEIKKEDDISNMCYFSLANALNLQYYFFPAKANNTAESVQLSNLIVDKQRFEDEILKMLNGI